MQELKGAEAGQPESNVSGVTGITGSTVAAPTAPGPITQRGTLKVQLRVNDQVAFESEDPNLWQDVLAVMLGKSSYLEAPPSKREGPRLRKPGRRDTADISADSAIHSDEEPEEEREQAEAASGSGSRNDEEDVEAAPPVRAFAQFLGVSVAECVTACAPSTADPFLHLDHDCWEDLKNKTPARGPGAVSPIAAAATLLALWFRHQKIGSPTLKQVQGVLKSLDIYDNKAVRGITNSPWLQLKNGTVSLRLTETQKAKAFAKHFCTRKWPPITK
ncbi:MAG TPA: hypothetical protein VF796_20345 [Humisphaera sp.]